MHSDLATREGHWAPSPHRLPPVAWQLRAELKFNSAPKAKLRRSLVAQKEVELHP